MKPSAFEVIIVGAGLAGLTAAYALAREGIEVLVIERGEYPGAKNTFGGVLYTRIWDRHLPQLLADAPLERAVERYLFGMIRGSSYVCLEFGTERELTDPANGYTVLRSRFDQWLSQKAEEAGAKVLYSARVQDLVYDGKSLTGVRVDPQGSEIRARAVILAEGVNGILTRRLGLGAALKPSQLAIGAKEVLALPEKTIDERFHVWGGRGAACTFVGLWPGSLPGGGFLYTNRETLSVGIVAHLDRVPDTGLDLPRLLAIFKDSYPVREFIRGAVAKEYSAHLIPEAGALMQPSLVADGLLVVGDAAGLAINTGYGLRGSDLAVASGLASAKTISEALKRGDLSREALLSYPKNLEAYGVLQDIRRFRKAPGFLKNRRLYGAYPAMACSVMERLLTVSPEPHPGLLNILRQEVGEKMGWRKLLWDAIRGLRSI